MGTSRLPRLKDVAKEANVSLTAASIILRNGKGRFPQQTRQRVLDAAQKLGWRRNLLVNGMQTGKTRAIGVLMPPINYYWADILFGIHNELTQKDYLPVTVWSGATRESFYEKQPKDVGLEQINRLIDRRVDGLILWPPLAATYYDNFSELIEKNIQVVVIDSDFAKKVVDAVETDEEIGGKLVAQHLIGLGHKHIACLSNHEDLESQAWAMRRRKGFEKALGNSDVACKLWQADSDGSDGVDVAKELLRDDPRPTAVFGISDYEAANVYAAAAALGLRIPEDLSVIGFSDLEFAKTMSPPLTTVRQRPHEIGQRAAKVMIDRLEGKIEDKAPFTISIKCDLITRGSTAKIS
ncbi:MAG: LacI family transcriptional regulator [Planctomycetes bacterium]|nr:LacI family transcriptional regulator [Planctomycetota bacterium]